MATTYFEPGTVAGGGAAPDDATYVTISANPTLSAERVLTEGDGISVVDGTTIVTLSLDINGIAITATAIADADFIPFWDVTATASNEKITWANLKAQLTTDGFGDVVGGGGTDNHVPRYDTTALLLQDSGVIIDDSDNVTGVTTLVVDGAGDSSFVGSVGVGTTTPDFELEVYGDGSFAQTAANSYLESVAYSVTATHAGIIYVGHSLSNTIGTLVETNSGDRLGEIRFRGVDTGTNWENAARIVCVQDAAAGTRVPARLEFYLAPDSTTAAVNTFTLEANADVTVESGDFYVSAGVIVCSGSGASTFVGDVEIGGGFGSTGITLASNGDISMDGILSFDGVLNDHQIQNITAALEFKCTTSAVNASFDFVTGDEDGTDWCKINLWAFGSRENGTNTRAVVISCNPTGTNAKISSAATGTETAEALEFIVGANNNLLILHNDGTAGINTGTAGTAQLLIDQANASGAIPVLSLDQGDVSEEMMEFITTIGTGNAIEAVAAKSLTTTHFIKVTIPGSLTRYIPVGTIA